MAWTWVGISGRAGTEKGEEGRKRKMGERGKVRREGRKRKVDAKSQKYFKIVHSMVFLRTYYAHGKLVVAGGLKSRQ